jgi:ABC-type multidrug transport system fused ATPase/permease subunit
MGMACLLVYTEPVGALLVGGALAVAGYSFHIITKRSILRWGESRHHHEGLRYKLVQEGLGGVRDVKILGREMEFIAKYDQHNKANADVGRRQNLVSALPRLWLEFLAVVGLSALVFLIIYEGKKPETMIPTLGLFATAAFRLMPSANKVLVAVQNLRYCLPVVNTLYAEKQTIALSEDGEEQSSDALIFEKTLIFDHVSYAYQETDSTVLSDLSFCIKKGSCVGFIGASGAGKSTLINVLLGLLTPTKGRVLVDEVDIQSNVRGWQNLVGYVPQSVFLMDDTLRNNIAFGLRDKEIDESAISRAVEAAQLSSFVASLPDGLSTNVGERGVRLSGGQCQRIGIARALYHDPPVLVLDEASSALDTETEAAFMAAVNCLRNDKTIVMVTHRLSTVSQCDELYEVAGGSVIKLSRIDSTDVV